MGWRKMSINHCHLYIGMPQNFFKHQYVSSIHHEVIGECMAQHMSTLSLWKNDTSPLYCALKSFSAWRE
jgi:hypothetical protein